MARSPLFVQCFPRCFPREAELLKMCAEWRRGDRDKKLRLAYEKVKGRVLEDGDLWK